MNKIEFKNSKIEFDESSVPMLSIDGTSIQVSRDVEANEFNAGELPYQSFKSVKELGETLVEQQLAPK